MQNLICILVLILLVTGCESNKSVPHRWSERKSNDWYASLPWIKGFNYVPSYAGNTTEWWENPLDTTVVGRELGWARDIGYRSARVFLQYVVWKKDPNFFKENLRLFLKLAEGRNIFCNAYSV
jgi:hypothetical protein